MAHQVLNLGSLNIDRVFRVAGIARPGQTIGSSSVTDFPGGKGANQSVALARAGVRVAHLGKIGRDGVWLKKRLEQEGIDTRWVATTSKQRTGQAIIQVDDAGQNAIVLSGGANFEITESEVAAAIKDSPSGSWFLVQNETSAVAQAIAGAHEYGLKVAFNPAPCDASVRDYPLSAVDLLCLNEVEGEQMTGHRDPAAIIDTLAARVPHLEIVLTLGAGGAMARHHDERVRVDAIPVTAVDTTAAGDTFLGYYLAARIAKRTVRQSLELARQAAALCVTRAGAMDSIPQRGEVPDVD